MDIEQVEQIIQEGIRIQMATWSSPLTILKNADKSKGQPEFCRTLENDWLYFNSESAKDKFYNNKIYATIEQQRMALLVMDWLNIASRRWKTGKPKGAIKAIIALRCMHKNDASYGWRAITSELRKMGVNMSHVTAMNYYKRAMDELMIKLNRKF